MIGAPAFPILLILLNATSAPPENERGPVEATASIATDETDDEDDLDLLLSGMIEESEGNTQDDAGEEDLDDFLVVPSLPQGFQSMNPDIGMIGDYLASFSSREDSTYDDGFLFRELELSFSAAVDTFARADAFVCVVQDENGDWNIGVEEAYATFLSVPFDLQPRIGHFRTTFGKANSLHLHALPFVDYPLVLQHTFGPDGLYATGAGVSWLVPNPGDRFMELTYEVGNADRGMLGGNDNAMFAGDDSDDLLHLLHFRDFYELSDAATLEAGATAMTAPGDSGHGGHRTWVGGIDLTYKWRPLKSGLYRSRVWQSEFLAASADVEGPDHHIWGMYSTLDEQIARRWAVGTRLDYAEIPDGNDSRELAGNLYLTFIQSEFLFWRLAYRYLDFDSDLLSDHGEHRVLLQCNFGIGPHRAHRY
jgi:hypothetical protein